jgi:hypothetical protein
MRVNVFFDKKIKKINMHPQSQYEHNSMNKSKRKTKIRICRQGQLQQDNEKQKSPEK